MHRRGCRLLAALPLSSAHRPVVRAGRAVCFQRDRIPWAIRAADAGPPFTRHQRQHIYWLSLEDSPDTATSSELPENWLSSGRQGLVALAPTTTAGRGSRSTKRVTWSSQTGKLPLPPTVQASGSR